MTTGAARRIYHTLLGLPTAKHPVRACYMQKVYLSRVTTVDAEIHYEYVRLSRHSAIIESAQKFSYNLSVFSQKLSLLAAGTHGIIRPLTHQTKRFEPLKGWKSLEMQLKAERYSS